MPGLVGNGAQRRRDGTDDAAETADDEGGTQHHEHGEDRGRATGRCRLEVAHGRRLRSAGRPRVGRADEYARHPRTFDAVRERIGATQRRRLSTANTTAAPGTSAESHRAGS